MSRARLLTAAISCWAFAVLLVLVVGCASKPSPAPVPTPTPAPDIIGIQPTFTPIPAPSPRPTPTPYPQFENCPPYYPCDVTTYPIPQYDAGADPLCYGKFGCPVLMTASPLSQGELNTLAKDAWWQMKVRFARGELKDKRTSENVPIRWDDPPTISICWQSFMVEHPACFGDETNVCTGKVSWVTAEPYKPATWRVAIRTDVDANTQQVLVVDGTVNLALMLTGNTDKYNGAVGAEIKRVLLGH